MNTRCQNSVLLLLVGLLLTPPSLLALSVSDSPVAIASLQKQEKQEGWDQGGAKQGGAKRIGAKKEDGSNDPLSASWLDPEPTSVFLPPSREFIRPLARAIRIHKEGDHVHAAELIGQFLVDMGEEDFLIFNDKAKGTAVSVSSIANEMLASLPDSAMEAYRVRFGVPARQRLNLAIAESNYFEIAQVKQRFLHTDSGLEAAMLLGHHHFDAGRVLLAAESFQTALDLIKQNGKSDSKLSVMTAVSWVLARRSELAEAVMKDLAKTNGGKFRLGDQDVTIDDDQPLAAIESFVGAGPLDSSTAVEQWLLVGGNTRRNVTTGGGFPVGQPLWQVDVDINQGDLQKIKGARYRVVNETGLWSTTSLVPANVPLVVNGLVLVGNENKIQAVDFDSGKRVWAVETGAGFDKSSDQPETNDRFLNLQQQLQQQQRLRGIVTTSTLDRTPWSDFLQGHASSDGKFIFRVVKSAAMSSKDSGDNRNIRVFGRNYSDTSTISNTLQAIDVLKEGELVWEAGGGKTTGDPRLTEISFLGAPLPVDGVLYAIGKRLEEVVLIALNSTDGNVLWMQTLASEENVSRSRYVRRSNFNANYSLRPSYSDGILVCPTGKNALVAVDTVGRRLLWGMQTTVGQAPKSRSASRLATLQNPQVYIENSRIVAFDVSSEPRLLAMDLLNGSPLMKVVGKDGLQCRDVLHVASVDEEQVVLVEKRRVRAVSSSSGKRLWETSIANFGPPTGIGYVAQTNQGGSVGRALYLPTEGNTIIKINLKKDKGTRNEVVDGIRAGRSFGNLIVHQGRVISRSETSVACFELDSKVVVELKTAIDKAGGAEQLSPRLKIKQAALLRNQGKSKQAIKLLKTIDPSKRSDRFKVEFLQNMSSMFDSDPEFALKLVKEHESWFQFETNPTLFLEYVELLAKKDLVDDMLEQIFQGDSFFAPDDLTEETPLLQRPIAGYNLPKQEAPAKKGKGGDGDQAGEGNQRKGKFDPEGGGNPFDDDGDASSFFENPKKYSKNGIAFVTYEGKGQKGNFDPKVGSPFDDDDNDSSFLERQKRFSKTKIAFAPNHWAKTQLIRTVRDHPESKAKIQAAIEQRLNNAEILDVVKRHRWFRQFPLELIAPKLRFELAKQLIAKEHVAEAENMLASLLGFLPTAAKQIEAAEVDLSKDALVALWKSIRDAQYRAKVGVAMADDDGQVSRLSGFNHVEFSAVRAPGVTRQQDNPRLVELRGELVSELFKNKKVVIWGKAQEVEFLDANGETEERFALFENAPNNPINMTRTSGWIQANHSLAVLRQRDLLLTMDLSKLKLGQPSVLWYKSITPQIGSQADVAGELDLIASRKLPPEDMVASFPTTGCCCFFDSDKLVCVDAFTGKKLWARTKDARHVNVLGNGSQVVTMDSRQTSCSVFDIRTGERIRTETLSKLMGSLCSVDRMSFVATSSAQQTRLEELEDLVDYRPEVGEDATDAEKRSSSKGRFLARYDLEANKFVWKKAFGSEAKTCRMAGDRILVLSMDNQIYVLDAKSGQELAKMPSGLTEAERKKVRYVGSLEHAGQDLVALMTAKTTSVSAFTYRIRSSRSQGTFFSGHLLLLSRGDIQSIWSQPAEVAGFNFLSTLPSASPFLILTRTIQSTRNAKAPRAVDPPVISGTSFQVLGLDVRTGKAAFNKIFGPIVFYNSGGLKSPIIDPAAGTIEIDFSGWDVKISTKKTLDKPPAPVASVTKDNPVPRNYSTTKPVVEIAESEFDIEELNQQLVQQAEEYEAALEQKRAKERALLESEAQ